MGKNKNVLKRAAIVQDIMSRNYEPGNQQKCQLQVLRNVLMKTHPMSERTLRRYLKINVVDELKKMDYGQKTIDF